MQAGVSNAVKCFYVHLLFLQCQFKKKNLLLWVFFMVRGLSLVVHTDVFFLLLQRIVSAVVAHGL